MMEGYIVHESLYYASEYIIKIDDIPSIVVCNKQKKVHDKR